MCECYCGGGCGGVCESESVCLYACMHMCLRVRVFFVCVCVCVCIHECVCLHACARVSACMSENVCCVCECVLCVWECCVSVKRLLYVRVCVCMCVWESTYCMFVCVRVCICEYVLCVCEWQRERQTEKVFAWNFWNSSYSKSSNSYLVDFCSIRQILLWKLTSSRLLASQGWPARCFRKWLPPIAQASLITDGGTLMETWTSSWASSAMFPVRSQAWHWRCAVLTGCLKLSVLRFKYGLCLYTEILL